MEHCADDSDACCAGNAGAMETRVPSDAGMRPGELDAALNSATFEASYQPIVRIADRVPVGFEALARLNHPTRGTLMPEWFVPQIEESGLAVRLTELLVDRALADLAAPLLAAGTLRLSLNFPLDVLLLPEALERLDGRRRDAGIPASRIVLEMTESRPVEDLDGLGVVLEKLRGDGYRVSIDDVLPAMPRLDELLQLPFGSLKFDRSVVQALDTSADMPAFMRRVIAMAQERRLVIVAEGVEDVPTWQRIAALGVELAQGFLIARSMPADAVPGWLEAWRREPAFE
jgi:EAL domain-containing protein (putative c-di-GMP-specific phosphodiesterase class I)